MTEAIIAVPSFLSGLLLAFLAYLGAKKKADSNVTVATVTAEPELVKQLGTILEGIRKDAEVARQKAEECESHREEDRKARERDKEQCVKEIVKLQREVETLARRLEKAALRSGVWNPDDIGLHEIQLLAERNTPEK